MWIFANQESYLTWCSPVPVLLVRELGTASTVLTVTSKTADFSYVHTCVSVYGFAHVNAESRRLDPWS